MVWKWCEPKEVIGFCVRSVFKHNRKYNSQCRRVFWAVRRSSLQPPVDGVSVPSDASGTWPSKTGLSSVSRLRWRHRFRRGSPRVVVTSQLLLLMMMMTTVMTMLCLYYYAEIQRSPVMLRSSRWLLRLLGSSLQTGTVNEHTFIQGGTKILSALAWQCLHSSVPRHCWMGYRKNLRWTRKKLSQRFSFRNNCEIWNYESHILA